MNARHLPWLAGVLVAVGAGVLGFVAPWSWWGAVFAAAVVFALVAARPVVKAAYAGGWTRTTVVLGMVAVAVGVGYASAVPPWGPEPRVYVFIALGLALLVLITFGGNVTTRRTRGSSVTYHETQAHLRRADGRRW